MPDPQLTVTPPPSPTTKPATYRDVIADEAKKAGIAPELAFAIVDRESSGRMQPGQPTPTGTAQGFFQLMPDTAKRLGVDPNDPMQNIQGGVKLLGELNQRYGGDVEKMLLDYHGGPDPAKQGPVTKAYAQDIIGRLSGQTPAARPAVSPNKGFRANPQAAASEIGAPPPPALPQYGVIGQPPPSPTQFEGPSSRTEEALHMGAEVLRGFDPRTRTGRQNIAGGIGGTVAGGLATVATPFTGGTSALAVPTASVMGAGIAGGLENAVENALTGTDESNLKAAGVQAGQQALGEGASRVLWAIPRRVAAATISKETAAKLAAMTDQAKAALGSALDRTSRLLLPVTRGQAGEAAAGVFSGPAKTTLNQLGEAVGKAAESGPALPAKPLLDEANALAASYTPNVQGMPSMTVGGQQLPATVAAAIAARNPGILASLPPEQALPGAVGYVQGLLKESGDTIPYVEVHKMKRLLDDVVNWDKPAKKQIEQVTKGLRQTIRDSLGVHQPYNEANAAYADTVKLFNRGYGPKIRKAALDEPGQFISQISKNDPNRARMLKELLVDTAAQQGPQAAAEGQTAWNAVRAAWTKRNLINGDPTKLAERMSTLDPEFVTEFYHADPSGRAVYDNLQQIAQAYSQAMAEGKLKEQAFKTSRIYPNKAADAFEHAGADVLRSLALGPYSVWGAQSILRLLHGPPSRELIEWAAFNNNGATPLLVKVLTSDQPAQALANLSRLFYREQDQNKQKDEFVVTPPPGKANRSFLSVPSIGSPPPAPPGR